MPKSKYSISSVADTFGPYVQEQELGNFVAPKRIPTDTVMPYLASSIADRITTLVSYGCSFSYLYIDFEQETQPHGPTQISHSHGTRRTRARLLRQAVSLSPVITKNRLNISKDSRRRPSRAQEQRPVTLFYL